MTVGFDGVMRKLLICTDHMKYICSVLTVLLIYCTCAFAFWNVFPTIVTYIILSVFRFVLEYFLDDNST